MEKNQEPKTTVTALGVFFDTEKWIWGFKESKLLIILHALDEVVKSSSLPLKSLESVLGKLVDVRFLVPGGRYNLLFFLRAVHKDKRLDGNRIAISSYLKDQAQWWMDALRASNMRSKITSPDFQCPGSAVEAWSDSAGGCDTRAGS